jgi:hypothetical protein
MARDERSVRAVPRAVWIAFAIVLALQIASRAVEPRPVARADALRGPPPLAALKIASLGEPVPLAQLMTLYLQAFDNQPGISIPFRDLDYARVSEWLATILQLDPGGQYPMLMASQIYAQVPDPVRQRTMIEFVHEKFLEDPPRRWRWEAHAAIMAKHRMRDDARALKYAADIARLAPNAPSWARQMHIFILEDLGETESARIILGGLLDSGEITDPREFRFLAERLEGMKPADNSTVPSKK